MAIQILGDGHALATRGVSVVLYTYASPVHHPRTVDEGLRFYGLTPHPRLRIRRLGFAGKRLRKLIGATFFWAAVIRDLLAHRNAAPVVVSRNRKISRRLIALRALLRLRYAIVQEIHEDGVAALRGAEPRAVAREIDFFRGVDAIVSTSPAVGAYLETVEALRPRVRCIPNGANVERFLATSKSFDDWSAKPEYVLAYAGTFVGWKGVAVMLEALCHLPSSVRLVIMGGKAKYQQEERAWLLGLAERLGVAGRVVHRGFVPPAEVPGELARADILLLPLGDNPVARYFTSPLKLFEYMASGVPIIAPAFPTITPFLVDHVSGVLVDPVTPRTIADAVRELIADPGLAARVGGNARREAPRYSRTQRAERLFELVHEVTV